MSSTAQLSARDRITGLLDDNSFVEVGAKVTKRSTDFNLSQTEALGDGVITGYGLIEGKLVYVYSQDAAVLHGSIGEMHAKKIVRLYDMAIKVGAPIIGLVDCAGLRLQEATDALHAFGEIYLKQVLASGVVPQITAVLGHCGGGVAISSSLSDFTLMSKENAKLFVNSPNVLDGNYTAKCDSAAASFQAEAGNVDFVCADDTEVLSKIRELISLIPSSKEENDSLKECMDDLNRTVPSLGIHLKDTAVILREISDNGVFCEVKADFAKEMVTGLIQLNGETVGAVANREELLDEEFQASQTYAPFLTVNGCKKAERFVRFCDAFHIPLLTLTNVKGYQAQLEEEKNIAAQAAKLTYAFAEATVPKVNVIIGKAYGSAYITMNSKHIGSDLEFAWENTEIGMMDSKEAVKIIYAEELLQAKDKTALLNEKAAEYQELQNSEQSAAKRGYVDTIIEPASTRKHLIYAYEMLHTKKEKRPDKKHGTR